MTYEPITGTFKAELRAGLAKAIEEWVDHANSEDDWAVQIGYVGRETYGYMTDAALAVLFGLSEAQDEAIKSGSLSEQ